MNILEIIWILATVIAIVWIIQDFKERAPFIILVFFSLSLLMEYYIDALTTPLW